MADFETMKYYNNMKTIKEEKDCNCPDSTKMTKIGKKINIHIINFEEDNVENYITSSFANNIIVRTINDLFDTDYSLKKVIVEDYRSNLRHYYHNYPNKQDFLQDFLDKQKTISAEQSIKYRVNDNTIDTFIDNDINIIRKMLKDNSKNILSKHTVLTQLIKLITYNYSSSVFVAEEIIIFVPYLKGNIIKIDKIILVGLYDIHCKCKTIPMIPYNLQTNWITRYLTLKDSKSGMIDNINGVNKEETNIIKEKKEALQKIKTELDTFKNSESYKKYEININKHRNISYKIQKFESIDFNKSPEVIRYNDLSKINNKEKRDAKIKELKKENKKILDPLKTEKKVLYKGIKDFEKDPEYITNITRDKEYTKIYNDLVDIYNMKNSNSKQQCKLKEIYKKQILENDKYISKHDIYIKKLTIVFKIAYILLEDSIDKHKLNTDIFNKDITDINQLKTHPTNGWGTIKCMYSNSVELCEKSKTYEREFDPTVSNIHIIDESEYIDDWDLPLHNKNYDPEKDKIVNNHIVNFPMIKFKNTDSRSYI